MIFDIFISKKSSNMLNKLDDNLKDMLKVFYSLEDRYRRKLAFIKRCRDEQKKGKITAFGGKAIFNETRKLLRVIGLEENYEKTEEKYSSKALNILKDLLVRWKTNRKLFKLTLREYSDLNILHESLRNLVSVLQKQMGWLKKHLDNPPSFIKNFHEFETLIRQEGIILGKEKELAEIAKEETKNIEEEYPRNFTYSLVGYGSLMNADETIDELRSTLEKAGTPIKDLAAEFKARLTPVWVVGYKRVFNKIATRKKWETDEDIKANRVAVLNISASIGHKFNAVAIKLTDDELAAIRKREKNYEVIALKHVYDYRTGQRLEERCICVKSHHLNVKVPVDRRELLDFYAKKMKKYIYGKDPSILVRHNKMPIPRYIEVIDIGVRKLDSLLGTTGMYDHYLNTTLCYYIDRAARKDYGEITLKEYYRLIGKEIERRLQLNII